MAAFVLAIESSRIIVGFCASSPLGCPREFFLSVTSCIPVCTMSAPVIVFRRKIACPVGIVPEVALGVQAVTEMTQPTET